MLYKKKPHRNRNKKQTKACPTVHTKRKPSMRQEAKTEKEKQSSTPATFPPWKAAWSQKRNFKKSRCPLSSAISVQSFTSTQTSLFLHQHKPYIHKTKPVCQICIIVHEIHFLTEKLVNLQWVNDFLGHVFRDKSVLYLPQYTAIPWGNL